MSATLILTGTNKEKNISKDIEFGYFFPGLRERWINKYSPKYWQNSDLNPILIPIKEVIKLYTGICAILALKPINHPLYPGLNCHEDTPKDGYWFLVTKIDCDIDENSYKNLWHDEFVEQEKIDRNVISKIAEVHSEYISKTDSSDLGDGDGSINSFYFQTLEQFKKELEEILFEEEIIYTIST